MISISFTGFLGSPAPISLDGHVAVLCLGPKLSGVGVLNLWLCQDTLPFEILMKAAALLSTAYAASGPTRVTSEVTKEGGKGV